MDDYHFGQRYADCLSAYLEACEMLFHMNRFVKHAHCTPRQMEQIYQLKRDFLYRLWKEGYCIAAVRIDARETEVECRTCAGTGVHWTSRQCFKCEGRGTYTFVSLGFWALRFRIGDQEFAWHLPMHQALWAQPLGEQTQHDVLAPEQAVALPSGKFREARALISWLLDKPPQNTDVSHQNEAGRAS